MIETITTSAQLKTGDIIEMTWFPQTRWERFKAWLGLPHPAKRQYKIISSTTEVIDLNDL